WVRTFIKVDAAGVDWTPMFAPPTDAISWKLLDGVDKNDPKTVLGQVLAPFTNKTVAYNGMYGCLPGTFRVAGLLQYRPARSDPTSIYASTTTALSSSRTATSRRLATSSPRCSSSPAPPGSRSPLVARTPTRSTA
ncbi:hypothetical protein, partial [Nannocystis sp.]|uniref:hypothetical protein n=1 Tax=Nannocystis sp. TaxID=1962667 RepID=UPI0025ED2916